MSYMVRYLFKRKISLEIPLPSILLLFLPFLIVRLTSPPRMRPPLLALDSEIEWINLATTSICSGPPLTVTSCSRRQAEASPWNFSVDLMAQQLLNFQLGQPFVISTTSLSKLEFYQRFEREKKKKKKKKKKPEFPVLVVSLLGNLSFEFSLALSWICAIWISERSTNHRFFHRPFV